MLDALPAQPPQKWHYRAQLLKARGKVNEAAGLLEERILGEASGLCTALNMLLDMALEQKDFEWAHALAATLGQTADLFGLWKGAALAARLEIAVKLRDTEAAMAALEKLENAAQSPWTPGDLPLYRHAHFKENGSEWLQKMPEVLRTSVWEDEHYAFLRDDPRCAARLRALFGEAKEQA